ncbi:transposase, IS605 OrfB family, central region [Blastococcus sp. DSM 46786]|nr:transposase, IS605 OrfB family, central region [Blastococcus sp. DSM 46786]
MTDVQAGVLLRAAGARRKAWNWAVEKIKANADQWAAEASYGIEWPDRVRADALHGFTARLARSHGVVVVEDLATKNLMANRSLAQAIGDQGWGELARQLTYKTARHGGRLLVADRWFASSKTCSACGAVRPKLALSERTYRCGDDSCGLVADRDVNAAANLAAWGEHTLGICPCVTQDGERHPGGPSAEDPRHACGGWRSGTAVPAAPVLPGEAGTSRPRSSVA